MILADSCSDLLQTFETRCLFLENIYSCFSNTYVPIYMFFKTYILAFQVFSTVVETTLWTLITKHSRTWRTPGILPDIGGSAAERGAGLEPSSPLRLTKPGTFAGLRIDPWPIPREILGCQNTTVILQTKLDFHIELACRDSLRILIKYAIRRRSRRWLTCRFCDLKDEDLEELCIYIFVPEVFHL